MCMESCVRNSAAGRRMLVHRVLRTTRCRGQKYASVKICVLKAVACRIMHVHVLSFVLNGIAG